MPVLPSHGMIVRSLVLGTIGHWREPERRPDNNEDLDNSGYLQNKIGGVLLNSSAISAEADCNV